MSLSCPGHCDVSPLKAPCAPCETSIAPCVQADSCWISILSRSIPGWWLRWMSKLSPLASWMSHSVLARCALLARRCKAAWTMGCLSLSARRPSSLPIISPMLTPGSATWQASGPARAFQPIWRSAPAICSQRVRVSCVFQERYTRRACASRRG